MIGMSSRLEHRGSTVTIEEAIDSEAMQDAVLGPLVRVVQEAAGGQRWTLVGAAACRLQGVDATSPNLEFVTTESALHTLAEMLDMPSEWGRGTYLAAQRLAFMRAQIPVFIFGNPVFHGRYESLTPMEIPSLWDARARLEIGGCTVLATPLEWELLLAVVLESSARIQALRGHMRAEGFDNRLLTRLLREGHVAAATEEVVWKHLEASD
jgi:hypothetical protein